MQQLEEWANNAYHVICIWMIYLSALHNNLKIPHLYMRNKKRKFTKHQKVLIYHMNNQ